MVHVWTFAPLVGVRIGPVIAQTDTIPVDQAVLIPHEAALCEAAAEPLLRLGALSVLLAPPPVCVVEGSSAHPNIRMHHAPLLNKGGEGVHLGTISLGCCPHLLGVAESVVLPSKTPAHDPRQHAGHLRPQHVGELVIGPPALETLRKANQPDPVPYSVVVPVDHRFIVGREPQLE